ncbi:Zinc-type alcohol dehydrogenase-like protein [Psilocybe cubensis]|uniref:Alcohol dehydrogenase-like C-terminal domain-containing protein n=2 Tax=Psilocybe cubensis TaxID=181762 RepID=A0A8H7Y530_PSICU|nr:Zinc-type alcohol dehydrogenase-like protein [Psilocybe cubensis]KAH9483709.1 Zinc-type alcohol dehydrogenase-like protein [Psilocybe cubensis]
MQKAKPGQYSYNALHGPTPIKAGDFVLVLGTGSVSIFALQFAAAAGATVIATSSSDDKLKIAAKHGAKHLINYNKTPNWDEEVMKITNGEGADHIIEVGGQGTLERSIKSAKTGSGYVQVIGFIASGGEASVVFPLLVNAVTLRGISIGSVEQPVIDKVFNFDDAIAAYAYLELQKHVGKVVIKVA